MKTRPKNEPPAENEEAGEESKERFVHLGSGCFLDRKTGHVIIL